MNKRKAVWRTLNGKTFDQPIRDVLEDAIIFEKANGHQLKICVGTDSQVYQDCIVYATVVVVLRLGKGGFMFIRNDKEWSECGIKERMLREVARSIEVAYAICDLLDTYNIALEVHADINTDPHFQSNKALKEAMGYILGMGFVFKAKPHAFASSSCADKVV